MKKLLSILISLLLLFGITTVGISVKAADYTYGDWTYSVSNNKATITSYSGTATNLNLPATLGGYKVEAIGENAFKNNKSLVSVSIPNGYINIGNYAFYECTHLNSVSIPASVEYIGADTYKGQTFRGCIRLETVTLAEGGSSEAVIGNSAFSGCTALKSITIPANYKTIGVNSFIDCTNLKTVVIKKNNDTYFERTIDYRAFYGCTALLSIDIPEGFISLGQNSFMECTNLKSVSIPKSIKTIGDGAFGGCIRLETIVLSEGGTSEATIGNATFNNCTALKSITIPANYKTIGANSFLDCTSLKTVVIKKNNDTYFERTIDYRAFYGCTALLSIDIPEGFISLGQYSFMECTNLKSVSIPKSIKTIGDSAFGGCIRLETVVLSEGGTSEATIGNATFNNCTALKSITIPANYKEIDHNAFKGCINLNSVIIKSKNDVYSERFLGQNTFKNCSGLTLIHIPKEFTSIGNNCFDGCSSKLIICSTTDDCAAKTFAKNNSITFKVCNGNHQLPVETHTVTYNANGGVVTPSKSEVEEGKSTILPKPSKTIDVVYYGNGGTNIPVKKSIQLNCLGWAKSSSSTNGEYNCGSSYSPTNDTTLYAVWQKTTVSVSSLEPERDGYIFLGWSKDKTANVPTYKVGEKINISDNLTLYAVWEKIGVKVDDVILNYKDTMILPIKVTGINGYIVEYSTSDPSVVTVDKDGSVTAVGTGTAEITVTVTDEYGNVVEDTCKVTVSYAWWQWLMIIFLFGWIWY